MAASDPKRGAGQVNRVLVAALAATGAGIGTFLFLPASWTLALFLAGIGAVLVFGLIARVSAGVETPLNPAAEVVLIALNLPSNPLKRIPAGWPLHCFFATVCYVVSLGLSFVFSA